MVVGAEFVKFSTGNFTDRAGFQCGGGRVGGDTTKPIQANDFTG